jgi:hypothetical protein
MNTVAIKHVRDHIANLPYQKSSKLGFNMLQWRGPIVLIACIAGWSEVLLKADGTPRARPKLSDEELSTGQVGDMLGLSYDDADALFYGRGRNGLSDITIPMAVKVLDHLLKTGEVDWSVA